MTTARRPLRSGTVMSMVFGSRGIPLAINHCVSLYPSEDSEVELNQIDFLRERYPQLTIGYSTHEYHDWNSSVTG